MSARWITTIIISLFLLLASVPNPVSGQNQKRNTDNKGETDSAVCGVDTDKILDDFSKIEFPYRNLSPLLLFAINDVMCRDKNEPANMANMAAIIPLSDNKMLFGIFHIHFNNNGNIIGQPSAIFDWLLVPNDSNIPQREWCNLIKLVYPEEINKWPCK